MTNNETEKEIFFLNIKSILVKSVAAAAITTTGLVAVNSHSNQAQAAVVQNDTAEVTITAQAPSIRVWNNYENPVATGQTLARGTSWKVIKTAYDHSGQKWYDLGKNQWIMAKYTDHGGAAKANNAAIEKPATNVKTAGRSRTVSANVSSKGGSSAGLSGSEAAARAWIASRESGGSYSARNGQYIGKYQLSASYLHGDYSAANQDRVANAYVHSRYGSWRAAQSFWESHGWY